MTKRGFKIFSGPSSVSNYIYDQAGFPNIFMTKQCFQKFSWPDRVSKYFQDQAGFPNIFMTRQGFQIFSWLNSVSRYFHHQAGFTNIFMNKNFCVCFKETNPVCTDNLESCFFVFSIYLLFLNIWFVKYFFKIAPVINWLFFISDFYCKSFC